MYARCVFGTLSMCAYLMFRQNNKRNKKHAMRMQLFWNASRLVILNIFTDFFCRINGKIKYQFDSGADSDLAKKVVCVGCRRYI